MSEGGGGGGETGVEDMSGVRVGVSGGGRKRLVHSGLWYYPGWKSSSCG